MLGHTQQTECHDMFVGCCRDIISTRRSMKIAWELHGAFAGASSRNASALDLQLPFLWFSLYHLRQLFVVWTNGNHASIPFLHGILRSSAPIDCRQMLITKTWLNGCCGATAEYKCDGSGQLSSYLERTLSKQCFLPRRVSTNCQASSEEYGFVWDTWRYFAVRS